MTERNLIEYAVAQSIAVLTLNDPPANTYSYEMMQQLDACILKARMDEVVQVIVITGSGEKFFCAGANIQMLSDVTPEFKYYFCLHANETLARLEQTPKLVIAAQPGTLYTLRFRVVGTTLQAKAWPAANTEPPNWMVTVTDNNFHSGQAGLRPQVNQHVTLQITSFTLKTAAP